MKSSKALFLTLLAGVLGTGLLSQHAHAAAINGTISFTGGSGTISQSGGITTVDFNAGDPFIVNGGLGDYAGVTGSTDFTDISASGTGTAVTLTSVNNPEWSFMSGGKTYSFQLTALTDATFTNGTVSSLTVGGVGIARITGFDDTFASFSLQGTGTGVNLVIFQASDTAVGQRVPDGGAAVALLGLALVGVEGLRRKLRTV